MAASKKIIYKIIRYTQKHSALPQTHEFMLGNRKTSIVVIDGDGYQEFNSKNIRVQISESISPAWPQEVEKYYEKTLSEIRQKKEKGENVPWNGSVLSLRSYRINRTPNLEEYTIELNDLVTSYQSAAQLTERLEND